MSRLSAWIDRHAIANDPAPVLSELDLLDILVEADR